jgi:branched-chain amino acid aminotransferase
VTLWVDGRVVADETPVVRADDHGLVVGDGVFETCRVERSGVFALTRHLRRLKASADGLGLDYDEDRVREGVAAVIANAPGRGRLRITITAGPSPYGSGRGGAEPTVLVALAPLRDWAPADDVVVVPWTRNERAATAGLKTTSYADNVVALAYAHERGAAEAIFANTRGELCEGTGSNVFFEYDGRLVTPPLSTGCLAGITRELLLEWVPEIDEVTLPVETLARSREAFLTSTTRDVQAIRTVDGRALDDAPGPLTRRAAEVFARLSAADLDP